MEDWFKQINPNVIVPVVVGVVGWLWHKIRHEKTVSLRDRVDAAITSAVHDLLNDPDARAKARARLDAAAWIALEHVGIKRNKVTQSLVSLAVEEGLAELAQELMKRDLAKIAAGAQDVVKTLEKT